MDGQPTIERDESSQLDDFMSKLLLRVFNSCPLLAGYIEKQYVGDKCVELVFHDIPVAIHDQLLLLFGDCPKEEFKFCLKDKPMIGFRLRPRPEDLSDLDPCSKIEPCDNKDPNNLCGVTGNVTVAPPK